MERNGRPNRRRQPAASLSPTVAPEPNPAAGLRAVTERTLAGAVLADTLRAFDAAPEPEVYGVRAFALGVIVDALEAAKLAGGNANAHASHDMRNRDPTDCPRRGGSGRDSGSDAGRPDHGARVHVL